MADPNNSSVTKADFQLFKQEMKHEYSLFTNNVKNNIRDAIKEQLFVIKTITIVVVPAFIVAFWTYFEFTSDKVDQLSLARLASMDERLVRMETIEASLLAIFKEAGIITDKKKDIKKSKQIVPVTTGYTKDKKPGKQTKKRRVK